MRVEELSGAEVATWLAGKGLRIRFGPLNVRLQTDCAPLIRSLASHFARYELAFDEIAELHLQLHKPHPLSRSVVLRLDDQSPFAPVPPGDVLSLLEQAIYRGIAARANHLLILRAAIVEKNGSALLLPYTGANSYSAEFCAELVYDGFRLASSTLGLLEPRAGLFLPLPGLPEGQYSSSARSGAGLTPVPDVQASHESITSSGEAIAVRSVVVLQHTEHESAALKPLPASAAFLLLAEHSVNYELLGATAFAALTRLIRTCQCYTLTYAGYADARTLLSRLSGEP